VPDAKLVAIACIGNVAAVSGTQGALLRALIRTKFREASPAVPVWLDLTDQMRTQFGVQPDVPNVAVIDTQGRLRYTDAGKFDREQLETLIGAIEDLRKEVRLSATTPQAP
jgi:predicted transcriptional regulator